MSIKKGIYLLLFIVISASINNPLTATNGIGNRPTTSCPKSEFHKTVLPADYQISEYLPRLTGKRVGLVIHQSSVVSNRLLADTLLSLGINIKAIFVPEHGFRGEEEAGAKIADQKDPKTGLPIISLYGKNKKPTPLQLSDIDVMVYDLQDVGVRFYTYISTMHYVMEACAENNKEVIILDRPNPNDHYIDGPILENAHRSFVGMHPIPIVYGMTCGELAQMINGEKWLNAGVTCNLTVIAMQGYRHGLKQPLVVKPSPNLPNLQSILLYPSLCLFEGTEVSIGRGTDYPFQVIGAPYYPDKDFSFTPKPMPSAKTPPLSGKKVYGINLTTINPPAMIDLSWLIAFYNQSNLQETFFNNPKFFDKLAGTSSLRESIINGENEKQIREKWATGLKQFDTQRKQYLLYP